MKMSPLQKHAIWVEAYQHDPDNPDYWLGGIPAKLWDDDDTRAEIERSDREFAAQWNQVFAQEADAHREGRPWDWRKFMGLRPSEILECHQALKK